ncbi:MAG: DUF2459 domain-containing protein, partial [Bacteroidota bacterium]
MILKFLILLLLAIFVILLGYGLLLLIGTLIPVNRRFHPTRDGIDLYLSTNGLHTSFVLPAKNEFFDWSELIDKQFFQHPLSENTHLSIGLGDKAFYLDVP